MLKFRGAPELAVPKECTDITPINVTMTEIDQPMNAAVDTTNTSNEEFSTPK